MKPYTVIYMDTKGPRVLGGFDDKGDCRRAWKHHRAGAAIVGGNDGAVLECKTGTSDSVKRQLEAYAAHLKRQGPAAEEPAPKPAEEPAAPPPPKPTRAKVKVARVELEVEEEADEPADAPEAAATCTAKGCKSPTAGVRSDTNPVLRDFCRRDRKLANDHARSLDGGVTEAAKRLREGTLTMTRQESGRRGGLAARRAKKAKVKAKPARKPVARRDLKPAKVVMHSPGGAGGFGPRERRPIGSRVLLKSLESQRY